MTFKEKENNFTELLNREADKLGKIFIVDSGEGSDLETDTMYLEDVSGWLCPKDTPVSEQQHDKWYCFAEWKIEDDTVIIEFNKH